MPEYLAPGVYVEETSFRAKSIEGVSTSTTAFAGATRKGPVGGSPELLTSFADFERLYGGFEPLVYTGVPVPNYLAHAVNAYFTNGGGRLYVSRAFSAAVGDGRASAAIGASVPGAQFVSRFPGGVGNGSIRVTEKTAPARRSGVNAARNGTLLRVGLQPPRAARVLGVTPPPFSPGAASRLVIQVTGNETQIRFSGGATAQNDLPASTVLGAPATLAVEIDGQTRDVIVPAGTYTPSELAQAVNERLRGGFASLTGSKLVIRSDAAGGAGTVVVTTSTDFGFTGRAIGSSVTDPTQVTIAQLDGLLRGLDSGARAETSDDGRLLLSTVAAGSAVTLRVMDVGPDSAHGAFGLTADAAVAGTDGAASSLFVKTAGQWRDSDGAELAPFPGDEPLGGAEFVSVTVETTDADGRAYIFEDLALDRAHPRFIGNVMALEPSRRSEALENLFAIEVPLAVTAFALHSALAPFVTAPLVLASGNDGASPNAAAHQAALDELSALEDVSIVAAPGHSAADETTYQGVQTALVAHASKRRAYRIAVLDTPPGQLPSEARVDRGRIDSTYAALYYPWVLVANPLAGPARPLEPDQLAVPPSGAVCGVYARTDINRGVYKAPANEAVFGAVGFERDINFAQQELLNPIGVNCLRSLPGQGRKVWGARVATSDPEWKYVPVRRYMLYLEASIDRGTQWAVFEPNGNRLWANVQETMSQFLYSEWRTGALLGTKPEEAFFVRCDRTTMSQNDLDNGRLICLIGVAVVKPAEFVIFRIGQKTADARS